MYSGFSFCEVISDIIDRVVSMVLSLLDRSGDLGEIEVGDDDEDEDVRGEHVGSQQDDTVDYDTT